MKTILKYKTSPDQPQLTLSLRPGFRVVRFDYVLTEQSVCLWIEQSLRPDIREESFSFRIVNTAQPVQDEMQYLSTAIDPMGQGEWHLYQQPETLPDTDKVTSLSVAA